MEYLIEGAPQFLYLCIYLKKVTRVLNIILFVVTSIISYPFGSDMRTHDTLTCCLSLKCKIRV